MLQGSPSAIAEPAGEDGKEVEEVAEVEAGTEVLVAWRSGETVVGGTASEMEGAPLTLAMPTVSSGSEKIRGF